GSGTNSINLAFATAAVNLDLNFTGLAQTIDAVGNQLTLNGQFQNLTGSLFGDALRLGPTHASAKIGSAAANNLTQYTPAPAGEAGSAITIAYTDPQAPNQPLQVLVNGTAITIRLATDASGAIISKPADIVQAVNANPLAHVLVTAQTIGN